MQSIQLSLKRIGKALICRILEAQVRQLRARHQFKVVAVAGGIGKTSTKLAIAETLSANHAVQYQKGNYNDRATIPLVFFGHSLPGLFNLPAWVKIFRANRKIIHSAYPYEYVIVELGTDGPGQMAFFDYLQPDIAIVTALVPEHMEYFGTMDAVIREELSVCDYSKQVLINIDDAPNEALKNREFLSYSVDKQADYHALAWKHRELEHGELTIALRGGKTIAAKSPIIGKQGIKITLAAAATAHMAGLSADDITQGLARIKPFAGRMQLLRGIKNSILIDDSYNASPPAVEAALDVLYAATAPQRIAILGSMNQLGDYSPEAHREVGAYCDADKLDVVVTIGHDAETYLAPVAKAAGCDVHSFSTPYQAGEFVKSRLVTSAIVLADGSQDGVYAEEALKLLLENPDDQTKLVRQSADWMAIKRKRFAQTAR